MGQKHKPFREFRTPFPLRDIRENPRSNVRACAAGDGAICSKNRKIVPYQTPRQNVCACVIFGHFRFTRAVRFLLFALRCLKACCCESVATDKRREDRPQIRKLRYVDNSLFQLLWSWKWASWKYFTFDLAVIAITYYIRSSCC